MAPACCLATAVTVIGIGHAPSEPQRIGRCHTHSAWLFSDLVIMNQLWMSGHAHDMAFAGNRRCRHWCWCERTLSQSAYAFLSHPGWRGVQATLMQWPELECLVGVVASRAGSGKPHA